jgi:hypothetical protein
MPLFKIDKDFWRRFRFYGFGLLLGCLLVSVITRGKACQMPSTLKLEELSAQHIEYTKHAACRMLCRGISEDEIKQIMKEGNVNYGKSEVHAEPCPKYAVEGNTKDGQRVRIIIGDCDTISRIITAIDLESEKDTCNCN